MYLHIAQIATVSLLCTVAAADTGPAASSTAHNCPAGCSIESHGHETRSQRHTIAVGLSGYSPVSYIESNRAEPGSPAIASEYHGVTYFFTNERQRDTFDGDPGRYLPAYGGYCAFGCSVDAKFIPDPTSFKVINGRTHLFLRSADVDARKLWNDAPQSEVVAKADAFWNRQNASKAYLGGRNVPASGIALDGYSPVSYFTEGRAEKGDPKYAVDYNGVTYHLTSARQVEQFKKEPSRYEPQCGGWCAFGMSVEDKFPVDPTKFKIIDDRLYLFLNNEQVDAAQMWERGDSGSLIRKADAHWKKVRGD